MRGLGIVGLFVLILACGAPRAVVAPTEKAMPKSTATIVPTAKPPLSVVSQAEYGDAWPLIVESGTIICDGASILLRTNRGLFAVNGTARGRKKWHDIREITKPDPANPALLMDVQPIVNRGLIVCR